MRKNYLNAIILLLFVSTFSNVLYGRSTAEEGVPPATKQDTLQNNEPKQKKDKSERMSLKSSQEQIQQLRIWF